MIADRCAGIPTEVIISRKLLLIVCIDGNAKLASTVEHGRRDTFNGRDVPLITELT
jgi:hypothetical protein